MSKRMTNRCFAVVVVVVVAAVDDFVNNPSSGNSSSVAVDTCNQHNFVIDDNRYCLYCLSS